MSTSEGKETANCAKKKKEGKRKRSLPTPGSIPEKREKLVELETDTAQRKKNQSSTICLPCKEEKKKEKKRSQRRKEKENQGTRHARTKGEKGRNPS